MAGYSYIFGGDTGETPESIKRKREIAEALMAYNQPKNVGEGIGAVARGLAAGITNMRANSAEKTGKATAASALAKLFGGGAATATAPGSTAGNIPMTSAANEVTAGAPGAPINMDGNQVFDDFMGTVKSAGVDNPNALAAIASTGKAESGFDPKKVNASWSDPSESGQPGMAGGIMSWRADRLNNLKSFAQQNGEDPSNISPSTQAKFFLQEDPNLIASLNAAKSPEEAQQLMNNAWKFAGYDRPGGEAARRIAAANQFVSKFQPDPSQVASLDPAAMMPQQGTPAAGGPQMALAPPPTQAAASPHPGYVDPIVSTGNRQQMPMPEAAPMPQQRGPQPPAPALPPPVEVPAPPQVAAMPEQQPPQQRAPSQQVAQALTPPPSTETGPSLEQLLQVAQEPFLSDGQSRVVNALIQQKFGERQAAREMQLKQTDPAYQLGLEKTRLELDKLKQDPGEIKVVGKQLIRTYRDGRVEDITPKDAANPTGKFRFDGRSVEGQALNGLIDAGKLTEEQAQQLGAGKTITDPSTGAISFMTPQSVFAGQAQAAQPQTVDLFGDNAPRPQGVDLFGDQGKPSPQAAPQPQQPSPSAPPAPNNGMIPLTAGKPSKQLSESERKNQSLFSVIKPELKVVEDNFDALTDPGNQVFSKMPFSEFATTPQYQQAANSLQTIVSSYLYSVSGATATPDEVKKQTDILTPRPGESKESIENKKKRIRTMVNAVAQAGSLPTLQDDPADQTASPAATAEPDDTPPPDGIDPTTWKFISPEDRKLWQK